MVAATKGRRWLVWLTGVVGITALAAGCSGTETGGCTGEVGNTTCCPNRNAYCPADGDGVSRPEQPATSPSGRFRLEVLRADPVTDGEDWRFRVVDAQTGAIVLAPDRPALDGGLGVVVAWATTEPDTVWTTRPSLQVWRLGADGRWNGGPPAPNEAVPAVVQDTQTSDTT
jgi:hypothetical protein